MRLRVRQAWPVLGAALCLMVLLSSVQEVKAMGTLCIFSPVEGKVVQHGQAVSGAVVEREFVWNWGKEQKVDQTTTDDGGRFKLPGIYRRSLMASLLPHQPSTLQSLVIRHAGKEYKAWGFHKLNYDENGELAGKPIVLLCALEREPTQQGEIYGICEVR